MTVRTTCLRTLQILTLCALLLLAGCYPTAVHPFYKADEVIYDKALIGDWASVGNDEKNVLIIKPGSDEKEYLIVNFEEQIAYTYIAHLFEINKVRMLDITPANQVRTSHTNDSAHVIFTHSLWRVNQIGENLDLRLMDEDKLKAIVGAEDIPFVKNDDDVVLTGKTDDLQDILRHHMDELFPAEGHSHFR